MEPSFYNIYKSDMHLIFVHTAIHLLCFCGYLTIFVWLHRYESAFLPFLTVVPAGKFRCVLLDFHSSTPSHPLSHKENQSKCHFPIPPVCLYFFSSEPNRAREPAAPAPCFPLLPVKAPAGSARIRLPPGYRRSCSPGGCYVRSSNGCARGGTRPDGTCPTGG